ncbi:alcohol dehydrogenase IV [Hymenopellis radicata]|nr:alcohol dehydrogenase IV [Hymenopellis radicata]
MASLIGFDTSKQPSPHGFYSWTDTLAGVYYGPGSLSTALPKLFTTLGVKKALIVTGKSLYTKTDVVAKVEAILKEINGYGATFYDIGEHSPIAGIRRGIKAFQDNGCDVIVSVGGGSPVDASKAMLYNIQEETGGPMLRQIAIPTTLSAAEYSIGAGFTDESGQKVGVSSQQLAPSGIILDAELTLPTPERLWLSTGIRALDHSVGQFAQSLYRPLVPAPVKVLCYAAMADLFQYLPASKADPQNVAVRQKLQLASWMSLWPTKMEKYSALGLSHALGHRLGATYGISHGITSCLTLAPVVALQAEMQSDEHKEVLAKAIYHLHRDSTGTVEGDIQLLSTLIKELVIELGLDSTLTEYNVPEKDFEEISRKLVGSDDAMVGKVTELLRGLR